VKAVSVPEKNAEKPRHISITISSVDIITPYNNIEDVWTKHRVGKFRS
jgi:hypothetical protein